MPLWLARNGWAVMGKRARLLPRCEFLVAGDFAECGRPGGYVISAGVEFGNDKPFFACELHAEELRAELASIEVFARVGAVERLDVAPDGALESGRWYAL